MPEVSLDFARAWVEFVNPADANELIRADLTWLTSRWTCIFGAGCAGIDHARPDAGCCTLGAHFSESADEKRVGRFVRQLTDADWQRRREGRSRAGWREDEVVESAEDSDDGQEQTARKTRVVDGACIFHNGPDFPGGSGCALHGLALRTGLEPLETKPDVCWQLPLRRTFRQVTRPDGAQYLEVTLSEYDRRGWGPGGHDLDWYCSGNTEAHVGVDAVIVSLRAEIVALLGVSAYEVLLQHCQDHVGAQSPVPQPGDRRRLTLHPATPMHGRR